MMNESMGSADTMLKIVLTGNTSVGKSCLAHYYENHTFEDREKTIGLEFVMKHVNINDKSCMIQLWDTAGEERFRGAISSYFKAAHCVVFIYDVTNKQSFVDIEKHYALVCDHCDKDAPLMLIGNKCDLDNDRVVEYNEGLEIAKKLGNFPFYETSSKSGQSVDECFGVVVENAINYVEKKYSLEKPPTYEHLEIAEEGQQPTSWFHRLFWCCFSTDSDSHRIMS